MAEQAKSKAVRTVPGGDIKPPWEVREMPPPPPKTLGSFLKWAGPAVVLGALSVGGFEAYQAGYVAANKWVGIYWVYVVSCFFQLLLNNEIARYTIATGETALQGFTRLKPAKFWGWVTALFCIIQQGWPAWIGGAAAGVAVLRNERVAFRSRTVAAMHGEVSVMRGLLDSGRKVLAGFLLIVLGIVSDLAALALLALPINQGGDLLAVGDFARSRALGGDWRRVD